MRSGPSDKRHARLNMGDGSRRTCPVCGKRAKRGLRGQGVTLGQIKQAFRQVLDDRARVIPGMLG